MSRTTYALPFLALAVCLVFAGEAQAQESTTRGFTLGVHASGASLSVESAPGANAGGGGIRFGYGLNRDFTLFAQIDGAKFDVSESVAGEWTMGHVDLGVRFHFANSLRGWVPYLQGAVTPRVAEVKDAVVGGTSVADLSIDGAAFFLGGGLMAYFTETLALDVQVLGSWGEFTQVKFAGISAPLPRDISAMSSRFSIGLAWWT